MENQRNRIRWPDGLSLSVDPSIPGLGLLGIGGTYYWNPRSSTTPRVTITGAAAPPGSEVMSVGPGVEAHLVFLREGMTSADTLGYGATGNVSTILPSLIVNSSIPDENYIPQIGKTKISSIEAGVNSSIGASAAPTYTRTPQQIDDNLRYVRPAMGPNDELSPFARTLQSGVGTVGQNNSEPPVRFLSSRCQNPLGTGMADWRSSVDSTDAQYSAQPAPSPQESGGLLGLMLDHLQNNPN